MIDLSGKVVLVTGASRGIGAAVARAVVACGGEVIVHFGANAEAAEAVAREAGADSCSLVQADLAAADGPERLWRAALAWRGRVDVLVNNAGVFDPNDPDGDIADWRAAWQRTLQINLLAAAELCRSAVAHFRERGGGIIVNVASRAAFRGDDPEYMDYAASKGGLVALTRSLARGYGADGVTAFAVAPGFVETDMASRYLAERGPEGVAADIPLGAVAGPDDVANVVVFLASGLARHATGTTIDVNGASYVR